MADVFVLTWTHGNNTQATYFRVQLFQKSKLWFP